MGMNGRWRPVESRYTVLDLDDDELVAIQIEGTWTQHKGSSLRVQKTHSCPEDPESCAGPARTLLVEVDTGEIVDVQAVTAGATTVAPSTPSSNESAPFVVPPTASPPVGERFAQARAARYHKPHHLAVACPACHVPAGTYCAGAYGRPAARPHGERGLVTAFDEAFDQAWPPVHNQRGVRALTSWLSQHADVLTNPSTPERTPSP
jgi:hypothetical protein